VRRPLLIPMRRFEDNIKMDFKEIAERLMDCAHQDRGEL
jgi:hypothetical protein